MPKRYYTENDSIEIKDSFYRFYKDEVTGGLRGFNGLGHELALSEVKELINGLNSSYLNISLEDYKKRTLEQIKYDVESEFIDLSHGSPLQKYFRKNLQRNYTVICSNCLREISTKTDESHWVAQSYHKDIYNRKFCSEWCTKSILKKLNKIP